MAINEQKAQLTLGWADGTAHSQKPAYNFRSRKESDSADTVTLHIERWVTIRLFDAHRRRAAGTTSH